MLAQLIAAGVISAEKPEVALARIQKVVRVDSFDWTGVERRMAGDDKAAIEIKALLADVQNNLSETRLTNTEKAKAYAILSGVQSLLVSPEPEWKAIVGLLSSPALNNIMGFANILLLIFQLMSIS